MKTYWIIFIIAGVTSGCTSSFYKETGRKVAVAAAYEQSDEKQRGMTQYEYEQMIKENQQQKTEQSN